MRVPDAVLPMSDDAEKVARQARLRGMLAAEPFSDDKIKCCDAWYVRGGPHACLSMTSMAHPLLDGCPKCGGAVWLTSAKLARCTKCYLDFTWQSYMWMAATTPETIADFEDRMGKLVEGMQPHEQAFVYRHLNAQGMNLVKAQRMLDSWRRAERQREKAT